MPSFVITLKGESIVFFVNLERGFYIVSIIMVRSACFMIVLFLSITDGTPAFVPTPRLTRHIREPPVIRVLPGQNGNNDKKIKYKDSEDKRIDDLLEVERIAAENQPPKIFEAISKTFWAILGIGLVLNTFGYGFIVSKDGIKIDTLENAQFQQELIKQSSKAR